ncbi:MULTISPECIES: flavin reductase [unclassified Agrobacterium]|uniref:flavin reductase n=1 Tax=unclassified Agrobacterium TaxID=2632611 RepID=UPI00083CE15E|nr:MULTISPECIES: flavin reductase [unclassified Agrobacterium]AOG09821.1 flavin reductase like domain protein [Agrobacterium sp. RAC06]MDZ7874831.1 flavin reductase [Rhizobium sp.]QGG90374.1 FMN reductase [Agrobacterium sp. MA01]
MLATKTIAPVAAEGSSPEVSAAYRNGMARLAAAVTIVTTDGPAGRAGFAATAVTSVSDNPPTLLVCLNKGSSAYPAVTANGLVSVNVLAAEHEPVSRLFGGKTPVDERFAAATWDTTASGTPRLADALVSFECRISEVHDGKTHDVLFCEVLDVTTREEGQALVYFDRAYRTV